MLRWSLTLVLLVAALVQCAAASGPAVTPPAGDPAAAPLTRSPAAPATNAQADPSAVAPGNPAAPPRAMPERRAQIEIGDSPTLGPADAPVTIVEFADFQCAYCKHSSSVVDRLVTTSSGRVRWVFKHYPLRGHTEAPLAHEAALAAGEQGKFWEMHHRLMRLQYRLKRQDLIDHAAALQLDVAKFTQFLDTRRGRMTVLRDVQLGRTMRVGVTPTYFVNGLRFDGYRPIDQFKILIDRELARVAASPATTSQ